MNNTIHSISFCADKLISTLQSADAKRCAVISTLKKQQISKSVFQKLSDEIKTKQTKSKTDSEIVFIENILRDEAAIQALKTCDCAVLLEQYGNTTYKSLYEASQLLDTYGVKVLGVFTI